MKDIRIRHNPPCRRQMILYRLMEADLQLMSCK
jgi:hypothetical protein